jgi:hypothetical protein
MVRCEVISRAAVFGISIAVVLAGCASSKGAEAGSGSAPTESRQKLENVGTFDLATCHPTPAAPSRIATVEGIVGFLVGARPEILECLVDPANRGADRTTHVVLDTTVTDAGVDHKVSGANLTREGTNCLQAALSKRPGLVALSKGQKPVTGHVEVSHVVGVSPAVRMGVNESSDVLGKIRLAQAGWCECYAGWKTQPPRLLKATVTLQKGKPAPSAVAFEPPTTGDAATDGVAACLKQKLEAMQLELKSDALTVPVSFMHIHSGVNGDLPGAPAELNFLQWDARRSQSASQTASALGNRIASVGVYDAGVARYKAKPDYALVKDLKKKCAALVESDSAWISALEKQLEVDQKTVGAIVAIEGKTAQWQEAEKAARASVAATEKDVEGAKKVKTEDQAACPKEKS